MSDRTTHAQAIEAANTMMKNATRTDKAIPIGAVMQVFQSVLDKGEVLASYVLSQPAIDEAWAREFIGRCREVTCHGFYDDRFDYTEDELTAELLARVGGREDGEEAWKNFTVIYTIDDDGLYILDRDSNHEVRVGFATVGQIVDAAKKMAIGITKPAK